MLVSTLIIQFVDCDEETYAIRILAIGAGTKKSIKQHKKNYIFLFALSYKSRIAILFSRALRRNPKVAITHNYYFVNLFIYYYYHWISIENW